ncbi:unnamed protein product [Heterobilharzia americana]|nr:unnamed protein product [Heterobilharzia americana]
MRVTRYLWINNLPARVTEQDIRDVLQSHGKIQSVRIHEHEGSNGAVVAFVDTKSATRAVESTVRLKKVNLSLQYCESSGVPGTNSTDQLVTPTDYTQASSTSLFQSDGKYSQQKSRSVSTVSDSSSVFHDPENKEQSQACSLSHTVTNRNYPKDSKPNMNTSPRFQNEHRGLKISHLPLRSSDTNLREGLFHEYKKHGKITSVFVRGQDEERICIITFKRSEDAERALASSKGKVFFGTPISVHPHEGLNSEDPDLCPPEHALDEYHPKATKTLFVGNLCSGTITQDELRRAFRCYGEIIEIDIKIQANQPGTSYAFIQYWDIKSVVRALQEQETIRVNGKPVKLGFGKSQPTNVVWLDNLSPTINETFLTRQFGRYGQLTHVVLDRKLMRALLYFDNVEVAQHAVNETRNRALVGRKVQIDYAGYECQVAFMRKLAKHDNFGQVYENYKERLQEVLSLLPYGAVIPYLGDRQRHFGDNQRDHFPSGNTKFSYRRSNCIRGSPVDRPLKYEQSNRNKCGSPVSPRSRSHQSDRRRTFITSSPDDYRLSTNWVGSHNNRNSHHGKSDLKSLQIEDRPVVPSHRKYQHNDIHTKSKSLRYLSQAENKSGSVSRSHIDQSNSRNRGQLLEETDDVSSGSFSSGYTNDDSFFEASSLRHSNSSSDYSAPASKLPSHVSRDHILIGDKRRNTDVDVSLQKCVRSNRYEVAPLEDYSYSSSKKHIQKTRDSASPQFRTNMTHTSIGRSRLSSSQHRTTSALDRNLSHGEGCHEFLEENSSLKHNKTNLHSQGRLPLKPLDADYTSPNYTSSKSKRVSLSTVSSVHRDSEYTRRPNTSNMSPISPDDLHYNKTDETYACAVNSASCSDIPITSKSHDTLTKLEMERAKLLRELSLLNNEVIGGGRGKGSNYTPNVESSSRKRAPSSLFANDLPSPKLKCVESTAKCDFVLTQSPTFISDGLTSPGTKKFTSNSHSLKRITTSHDSKCSILTSTQEGNDKHVYVLSTESHSNRNDATSPSQKNPLAKPPSAHDIRSLSASSRYTALSVNTITHGLDLSVSRPSALMTSSPRMLVPPEPTSPMIHISPPSSPIVMDKSYASTPNAFLSSSVPTPSTSGSIASSVTNSCSRDPRLAVHINQLPCDVPPPPPETFKLPLWVDTSPHADVISNSISSSVLKPQSPLVTKSIYDVDHGVSIHDSSVCSLDERIRLLDVQLMKSEKARPTVDYSKFRIRRKTEAGSTSQSTQSNGATQCISGVSVISCSPHSPVLTVSTYSVSTRHELAVTDNVNPSLPVSSSATTVPKSPILSSTTPLSLVKPADTSEFVKSMLSFSKPSPSTPCNDTPNNLFSNEVMPVARHPATVSLCTNSFLSRLPRSIVNSMSSTNSIQSSDSFCNKLPIANNNRIHATVCNLEHSSLSGAQPVGVATRMPSVRLSCVSDILSKAEDNDLVAKCNTKLNTRKESMDYVEKCESSILPNSVMNTSTDFNVTLPLIVSDNQKSVDITGKITEPSASSYLGSASALPVKTNQKLTSSQSVACSKSSPQDDLIISDSCKPTSLSSLPVTNAKKIQKNDSSRSALDDFVFQNSLGSSTCKTNRLKKQLDCSTLLMPTKRKPTTTFEPKETVISNVDRKDLGNLSLLKIKAPEKTSSKNVSKKSEFVPESNMQKDSTPNCKPQLTSDDSQSTLGSNNRLLSSLEKKTVSPHSRKRKIIREIKKKTIDSEDSDWEQNAVMSSNSCDLLDESNYESMYDKIKRRANQSTTKSTDSLVKPSVLQRLFKVKGKQSKKADTHKSLDSDTDECLSDGSSNHSDNTSTVVSKRTGKSSFLSNETLGKSVKQKVSTSSGVKTSALTSLSPKRKRIVAQSEISSNESSHKTRSRRAKKSEVLDVSRSITIQVKRKHKGELQKNNASGYRSIRRKKLCITEENDTTHGNESKTMSGRMSSTVRLRSQKQRNVSSESKRLSVKNSHRSLVHRVFASTDSSSLSSSVMSEASEDEMSASNNQVSHSVKEKTDKKEVTQEGGSCQPMKSKSPSPRMSRSCSPEDLRADAAIRHTFGAFTAPFMCLKTDSPCNAVVKQSAPQTSDLKFSPNFEDSRPTPPTLPMTDSSFSGDQYSNGGITTKSQIRDHSDWNIFSSLAKQSTPIKDDSMQQNLSSSGRAVDSDSTPANAAVDMSYDTEDELPCLEKHDDDELNNPYESSILLHESDSFSNNTKNLNVYNDDDLPPPVVSEVDQLSYSDTVLVSTGTVSDIIEEVIYDSLEVPVSDEGHLITDTSIKSDLCENFPIVTKSIVELTLSPINEEAKQPFLDACSASNTDVSSLHGKVSFDVSSVVMSNAASSVNSVTIQSTALNSVTMSATPQPSDLQNTHQPMLVAVPTTSAGNLSSSKLALLTSADNSGSNSCSSLSSSVNSVSQCHIAVILPTTSVSLSGDSLTAVSSVVSDSHISATPNVAVTKPGYPSLVVACSPPPFTCVTLTSCQSLHPPTTQTSQAVTYSQTTVIAMPSVSSNSSLDNGIPTSHPCLASESQIGNTSFDPSDFTSYVQRVIERVKQEKDEEILQQREKVKRPRRNANISMSSASTSINYTNIIATVTSPSVFSPITTALSSVISSPSVSATDVLKSQSVSVFDDKNVMISMCSANSSTAQECNPISIKNTFSPNPQSNSILDSPSATNIQTPHFITDVYSEQNHLDSGCNNFTNDSHSRDPVDETIEAVVNGEFDEKEYVLKLLKGAFVPNGHYRTLSGSIGSPSSHSDTVTLLPENSSMKGELNQPNVPESVYAGSPNSAFNIGVHSSCPMSVSKGIPDSIASTCQSSTVLTPMHVLTFVAASTATCTSQNTCTSTAISPIVSTQSVSNLTNSAHHISSSLNSSSSGLDKNSNITPLTAYATIPNSSDSLSTNSTNTCIGEFAARLANNPFTTYFYSLLTQKQLSPSLSPSISSGDSLCQRPNDNMTLPLCPSTTLKKLSIPNASVSGDTADYLAAATMAAMAAMTGPTQDMTSFAQTEASESYPDHKAALSENQFLQMWSAAHLRIQEYPVIWRGRLSLKNEEVFVNMHYISGNQDLMKSCMGVIAEQVAVSNIATSSSSLGSCVTMDAPGSLHQPLKIVQRMRLETSQLEGVQRKLRQINDFCMCLTLAAPPPLTPEASVTSEQIRMNRILCDGFIKYMLDKCAAGIINVCHPCTQQNLYVIHIFPPCDFSRCQLQVCAPALSHSLMETLYPMY